MDVDADMEMNFEGDDNVVQQMKAAGMELPMKIASTSKSVVTNKVASETIDGKLPFVIEYNESKSTQSVGGRSVESKGDDMKGMKIYGHVDENGKSHADSINRENGKGEEFKAIMDKVLSQVQVQTNFPEKPMKIGDVFTDEQPVEMPVSGGGTMKMIVKTKYKLVKVEANEATFDLVQDLTLDMKMDKGDATLTGSGTGIMTFNIKEQFATAYDATVPMKMKLKVEGLFMTMNGVTKTKMNVVMQ